MPTTEPRTQTALPAGWVRTTDPTDGTRAIVGPLGQIVKRDGVPSCAWTCYWADGDVSMARTLADLWDLIGE